MVATLRSVSFLVHLVGLAAIAMIVPLLHAWVTSDWPVARAFLHSSLMFGLIFIGILIASRGRQRSQAAPRYLVSLAGAYTIIPLVLTVPILAVLPEYGVFDLWFEMVSSFTTTGATLLPPMPETSPSIHLWRAEVGWLGGFLAWVMAAAIFAPLNLGGYEVSTGARIGRNVVAASDMKVANPGERLVRFSVQLFPIYLFLTLVLWLLLIMFGSTPFVGLCHAMSTMATSGISPVAGLHAGQAGIGGEIFIALFLIFALSHVTFREEGRARLRIPLRRDPELLMGGGIVLLVVLLLFARHWVDPLARYWDMGDAINAVWGTFFTALSFLTTTGFESGNWRVVQIWSGLETPALLLMGLALVGGGVATTAGGVKLLRVFALYRHGLHEMGLLVHPNSIGGAGREGRHIRRQGAYIAWIFFMLFAMSIAATLAALTLTGLDFHGSLVLTIAGLTNTGPIASMSGEAVTSYAALGPASKMVVAVAMIVGRLELLAIIALANPAVWRS